MLKTGHDDPLTKGYLVGTIWFFYVLAYSEFYPVTHHYIG